MVVAAGARRRIQHPGLLFWTARASSRPFRDPEIPDADEHFLVSIPEIHGETPDRNPATEEQQIPSL